MIKKVLISSSVLAIFLGVSFGSTATAREPVFRSQFDETSSGNSSSRLMDSSDPGTSSVDTLFEIGSSFNPDLASRSLRTRYRYETGSSLSLNSGSSSGSNGIGSTFNSSSATSSRRTRSNRSDSSLSFSSGSSSDAYSSSGPNTSLPDASLPNADPNWH